MSCRAQSSYLRCWFCVFVLTPYWWLPLSHWDKIISLILPLLLCSNSVISSAAHNAQLCLSLALFISPNWNNDAPYGDRAAFFAVVVGLRRIKWILLYIFHQPARRNFQFQISFFLNSSAIATVACTCSRPSLVLCRIQFSFIKRGWWMRNH